MFLSNSYPYSYLPYVNNVKYIVFSDFDETYFAHDVSPKRIKSLYNLEDFLLKNCKKYGLLFGWVTGSSIKSVLNKIKKYDLHVVPHFIAGSLGTELDFFKGDRLVEDKEWKKLLLKSNFTKKKVAEILNQLNSNGISLFPQLQDKFNMFKLSYYYYSINRHVDENTINCIKTISQQFSIKVNVSFCNSKAGDPENCYDIDFIPSNCGKQQIVSYVLNKFNVDVQNTFAFGDSGNDIEMLKSVTYGYLVENSTDEAKLYYKNITNGEYTDGIYNTLTDFLAS